VAGEEAFWVAKKAERRARRAARRAKRERKRYLEAQLEDPYSMINKDSPIGMISGSLPRRAPRQGAAATSSSLGLNLNVV
jgi:hypothetical protein